MFSPIGRHEAASAFAGEARSKLPVTASRASSQIATGHLSRHPFAGNVLSMSGTRTRKPLGPRVGTADRPTMRPVPPSEAGTPRNPPEPRFQETLDTEQAYAEQSPRPAP